MPRIDSQMQAIYQNCTQGGGSPGAGRVSQDVALKLIERAKDINASPTSCSYSGDSHKGNKYLTNLMADHEGSFTMESLQILRQYIETGHVVRPSGHGPGAAHLPDRPDLHLRPDHRFDGGHPGSPMPVAGGHHDMPRPGNPVSPMGGYAGAGRPGAYNPPAGGDRHDMPRPGVALPGMAGHAGVARPGAAGGFDGHRPGAPAMPGAGRPMVPPPPMPSAPDRPSVAPPAAPGAGRRPEVAPPAVPGAGARPDAANPNAPVRPNPAVNVPSSGVEGPRGREILNFQANKKTWHCHWFPMQERRARDSVNNLYAENGCLSKLDSLNGGQARDYEYQHNRKGPEAGASFGWWGHCNNASEAACILREPLQNVTMTGANGQQVVFTPADIQGLLVKVTPGLINKVDFRGNRFNMAERDNPNDPAPELFLSVMQEWSQDGLPFVLDIDPGDQVWNYPYDTVRIYESSKAPEGFNAPGGGVGDTRYYHTEMSGTGFDKQKRVYEFYIQRDGGGNVTSSGWINTPNSDNNPDFMWRPHPAGDLTNRANWKLSAKASNPNVDAQLVYDIYMKSIM